MLSRSPTEDVYQQIISDLRVAHDLLSTDYLKGDALSVYPINLSERVRPTKWAALTLLARVHLYMGDYSTAEADASTVMDNVSLFDLAPIDKVFNKNSVETIWSLQPVGTGTMANTLEGAVFILPPDGPNGLQPLYLSELLLNNFESDDQRKNIWIDSVTPDPPGTVTFYFPSKYKVGAQLSPVEEYSMVLRLAELYLIRAEARAQQNKIARNTK